MTEQQLPLFPPNSEWRPTPVSELPSWASAKRIGFDIETRDPELTKLGPGVRRGGYIAGISFAIEDGPKHYVPMRHAGGDNVDVEVALQYFRDQAKAFKGDLVGAHLGYDLDFCAEEGIKFQPRWFRDVLVAEPLLNELRKTYTLDSVAGYWELPGKDETLLRAAAEQYGIDPKSEMWKLPARYVAGYAMHDSLLPLQLIRRQEKKLEEEELWDVYNLESRVLPITVGMRRWGVRIDLNKLEQIEEWTLQQEAESLAEVKRLTGCNIAVGDVWKKEVLIKALNKIGVGLGKTPSGQPKLTKGVLETIDHPVAALLVRARKVNKVRTTFAASIRRHETNGRVHCTFNQLRRTEEEGKKEKGAAYGRMSSSDLNLQQQPVKDPEIGPLWRSIFIADDGKVWACNDYSQQEPRVAVHYAELCGCRRAKEAAQRYRDDPTTDSHTMTAQLMAGEDSNWKPPKVVRNQAKITFLGIIYGMGAAKLCHDNGFPTKWVHSKRFGKQIEVAADEGEAFLKRFHANVPYAKQLAKMCTTEAIHKGYVTTISGRRCRFPWNEEKEEWDWTHKALNRVVQGTSADQTKMAMVACTKAGFLPQLQVHDELDRSMKDRKEAQEMANIMENCLELQVPSKVDVECGPSWGEIK